MKRNRAIVYSFFFLLSILFYVLQISDYDYNPTSALTFGCYSNEICFATENQAVLPDQATVMRSGGYDGQFYYYIAASLYSNQSFSVDFRPFRLSRIVYPLITGWAYPLAGPSGLMIAMLLIPLFLHLVSAMVLDRALGSYASSGLDDRSRVYFLWIYLVNPLWMESFVLHLSDSVALSFSGLALASLVVAKRQGPRSYYILLYALFASLSILAKETFLAIILGLSASVLLVTVLSATGGAGRHNWNRGLWYFLAYLSPILPLILWWWSIGFSPLMAASRGGFPFQGMMEYLQSPDAVVSGRSFLIALFFIYLGLATHHSRRAYTSLRTGDVRPIYPAILGFRGEFTSEGAGPRSLIIMTLFANMVLISFATAHEYWANFANIARLFTPGVLMLALDGPPEEAHKRQKFFVIYNLLFILVMLYAQWRNGPLDFYVLSR